jgi:hypothetical protein
MRREDIRAFASRDWNAIAESKAQYWRSLTPAESIRLADQLRRQVLSMHPDWPSESERQEDFESHVRVSRMLKSVARRRRG